jgi:hypothetical protein
MLAAGVELPRAAVDEDEPAGDAEAAAAESDDELEVESDELDQVPVLPKVCKYATSFILHLCFFLLVGQVLRNNFEQIF